MLSTLMLLVTSASSRSAAPLPPLQLINERGDFAAAKSVEDYLRPFAEHGRHFGVISVIGPQSSGKSTLLNALFDSSFDVLQDVHGRQRTTKGVWLQEAPTAPGVLLLDVQGTDSREAGDDGRTFERMSALFALSISDTLCINLWEHDVGRQEASSLALLHVVFELALELRAAGELSGGGGGGGPRRQRQTLLFIVRDKTGGTPERVLHAQIAAQLGEVWAAVWKPKAAAGDAAPSYELDELFDVQVTSLPHLQLQAEDWAAATGSLARRLALPVGVPGELPHHPAEGGGAGQAADECPLLGGGGPFMGVPADGLCDYSRLLWSQIVAHAPLHLPSQQALVADHRCGLLCKEAARRGARELEATRRKLLPSQPRRGTLTSSAASASGAKPLLPPASAKRFRSRVGAALLYGLDEYDSRVVGRYDEETAARHRASLSASLWAALRPVGQQQLRRVADAPSRSRVRLGEGLAVGSSCGEEGIGRLKAQLLAEFDETARACAPSLRAAVRGDAAEADTGGRESAPAAAAARSAPSTFFSSKWAKLRRRERQRLGGAIDSGVRAWREEQASSQLQAARWAEAQARSMLEGLATRRASTPFFARLLLGLLLLHRVVALLRAPLLPLSLVGAAAWVAPVRTRALLGAAAQQLAGVLPAAAGRLLLEAAGVEPGGGAVVGEVVDVQGRDTRRGAEVEEEEEEGEEQEGEEGEEELVEGWSD